jgi:hypothetical protein
LGGSSILGIRVSSDTQCSHGFGGLWNTAEWRPRAEFVGELGSAWLLAQAALLQGIAALQCTIKTTVHLK